MKHLDRICTRGDTNGIKHTKMEVEKMGPKPQVKVATPQPAQEPRRWGQPARSLFDPLVTTARPAAATPQPMSGPAATPPAAPNMAQSLRASRDNTPLTGHQTVARNCGLDPQTPGVETMTMQQMKDLAYKQQLEATEPMFRAHGKCYRR
ncbi:MAG: hypothetical protein JJE30_08915 [Desulfuromonadales bacterium]|nr:hypothetical protein [Desulfuromonadales bacterium]